MTDQGIRPDVAHAGELDAQARYGDPEMTARVTAMVRDALSPAVAEFLAGLRLLFLCAADDAGDLWVSPRSGPPGFVTVADERTVVIAGSFAGDPVAGAFARPRPVGVLALDPSRRRRARVNGVAEAGAGGLVVHVEEAFPNCTRFIRSRRPVGPCGSGARDGVGAGTGVEDRVTLSDAQRRAVAGADTVVVGTCSPHGADCSHRGGDAGFVEVLDPGRVRWRERDGNAMLASVGNLLLDARCALAVVDFGTGAVTLVSGTAELAWPGPDRPDLGDGRSPEVTMTVRRCRTVAGAIAAWLDDGMV